MFFLFWSHFVSKISFVHVCAKMKVSLKRFNLYGAAPPGSPFGCTSLKSEIVVQEPVNETQGRSRRSWCVLTFNHRMICDVLYIYIHIIFPFTPKLRNAIPILTILFVLYRWPPPVYPAKCCPGNRCLIHRFLSRHVCGKFMSVYPKWPCANFVRLPSRGWINIFHQTGSSENHRLKMPFLGGYVSFLEGMFFFPSVGVDAWKKRCPKFKSWHLSMYTGSTWFHQLPR